MQAGMKPRFSSVCSRVSYSHNYTSERSGSISCCSLMHTKIQCGAKPVQLWTVHVSFCPGLLSSLNGFRAPYLVTHTHTDRGSRWYLTDLWTTPVVVFYHHNHQSVVNLMCRLVNRLCAHDRLFCFSLRIHESDHSRCFKRNQVCAELCV